MCVTISCLAAARAVQGWSLTQSSDKNTVHGNNGEVLAGDVDFLQGRRESRVVCRLDQADVSGWRVGTMTSLCGWPASALGLRQAVIWARSGQMRCVGS